MGAKTSVLVASGGDCRSALLGATGSDRGATEELVRSLFPGRSVALTDDAGSLGDLYPQPGICLAGVFPSVTVVASMWSTADRPSALPAAVRDGLGHPRVVLHAMHSAVDWLAFAVWERGRLVRAISLAPDYGIIENIGDPLPVEAPFWAGVHPVDGDYSLPFHPLELGEELLADQFGFILEGFERPDLFDPYDKPLWVFAVDDEGIPLRESSTAPSASPPAETPRRRRFGFRR